MKRKARVLQHLNKSGIGIEIGPGFKPIAPKKEGFKVEIIDYLSREQLIAKYKDEHTNLESIEEVDYVWHGESYADLTGKTKYYDWIIASHVIEHTPDLIDFLNNCDAILKDDGVLYLVVPDKRYCFDHFRPITGISKIIDCHLQQATINTPGTAVEYFLNVVSKEGHLGWNANTPGDYTFIHSLESAVDGMGLVINENKNFGLHSWCFVPHSFRLIVHDLYSLGFIALQEVDFSPTEGCEFFVSLARNGEGITQSRMALLKLIESEIKDQKSSEPLLAEPKAKQNESFFKRLTKRFT